MKRICVSQRVDISVDYGERRDALDQRWHSFLRETGAIAFPVPNDIESAAKAVDLVRPDGILLTGGNSPVRYGGNAPERDAIDSLLLDYAIKHGIPLIGVCRGMQSILLHFGGTLKAVESHIAVRHKIDGKIVRMVNSYHGLTADFVPSDFEIMARSEDGTVEAVKHKALSIFAMMWHPEREEMFSKDDADMFTKIWCGRFEDI